MNRGDSEEILSVYSSGREGGSRYTTLRMYSLIHTSMGQLHTHIIINLLVHLVFVIIVGVSV